MSVLRLLVLKMSHISKCRQLATLPSECTLFLCIRCVCVCVIANKNSDHFDIFCIPNQCCYNRSLL